MGTQLDIFFMDGAAHQKLQYLGMAKRQKANHPDNEGHGARLLKGMETILNRLYYIGLTLALSAVLWGTMILVLVPFAYGSEFGSSTISNSTTTTFTYTSTRINGTQTWICDSNSCPPVDQFLANASLTSSSQSTRISSVSWQLGIVLSVVLVSVLAAIAYFRRKK